MRSPNAAALFGGDLQIRQEPDPVETDPVEQEQPTVRICRQQERCSPRTIAYMSVGYAGKPR